MNSKRIYASIGRIAGIYDTALQIVGYEYSVKFFISRLPFPKEASLQVLDAGCGTGLYTLAILKQYPNSRITAFDLDEKLVERLRQKIRRKNYESRARLFVGDIQKPSLQTNEFDLVITAGVLEYVPIHSVVRILAQSLRAKGHFFNSPVRDTWWGHVIATIYACKIYSRKEAIEAFEPEFRLQKIIQLPWYILASFKEGHLFQKI